MLADSGALSLLLFRVEMYWKKAGRLTFEKLMGKQRRRY